MPFVGEIKGRPSILEGNINNMIKEAKEVLAKGVYGIDLLGYRFIGDAVKLNKEFTMQIDAPVCIAGSINSYKRLEEIKEANPWAFTIGGGFFENKFGDEFKTQINKVCDFARKNKDK